MSVFPDEVVDFELEHAAKAPIVKSPRAVKEEYFNTFFIFL